MAMEVTKSETKITVNGKDYGSVDEMSSKDRELFEDAEKQLKNVSVQSIIHKVNSGHEVVEGEEKKQMVNYWILIFGLGMLTGAVIMYLVL